MAVDLLSGQEKGVTITGSSSLSSEEIARMLTDAELNKDADDFERELSNLLNNLRDEIVQIEELLRVSNVLPEEIASNLIDLKASLEDGLTSRSLQILESLIQGALADIKEASEFAYEKAKEYVEHKS
jgi:molecular chaperone DnaK (HSP70)